MKAFPALLPAGPSVPESSGGPGTTWDFCVKAAACLTPAWPQATSSWLGSGLWESTGCGRCPRAASGMTVGEGQVAVGTLSDLGWALPLNALLPVGPRLQSLAHTGLWCLP